MRLIAAAGLAFLVVGLATMPARAQRPPAAEPETPARQAAKVFREALSQMKLGQYQQAADLFSQMIKRYGGNESVPDAQIYLAHCLRGQNKDDEFLKQIDLVIRTYAGTEVALLAINYKLTHYSARKEPAGFLETLRDYAGPQGTRPIPPYLLTPSVFRYYYCNVDALHQYFGREWNDDLMKLCTRPELAEQALQMLSGTFKQGPDKLSHAWMWAHCWLLFTANKDAEAEKVFKEYTDYWGQDVRGRLLWWEYAEYLRTVRKKPADARKAYETIMDRYEGTDTAGDAGAAVAQTMAADDAATKDFLAFADKFIARYKLTEAGNRVASMRLAKVIELAPKDPQMAERAFALLQEEIDKMLPPDKVARIESQIKLAGTLRQMPKAVALMNEMLSDDLWSAMTWNKAVSLSNTYPELKLAVEAARRRRQVHETPTLPAATTAPASQPELQALLDARKLLADLKVRIKDGQMRHAEEIAEDLFTRHTDTAFAVEAVQNMCDYYFRQVMVEPRDKWMERMISTWPYHPRTEEVLNQRCISDKAAAEYDKLTRNVELALARFPSSQHRHAWYSYRLTCYEAAKDAAGRHAWIAKELNWAATHGHYYSIQQIVDSTPVPEGRNRTELIADVYVEWGRRFGQTHLGLWCYSQAHSTYSYPPNKLLAKAVNTSTILRTQKVNPATAWYYQFDDIDLLLAQEKFPEAVSEALKRLPTEPRPQFRTYRRRLDMSGLGQAFGKIGRVGDCKSLAGRLTGLYKIPEDIDTAELMLASAYAAADYPNPSPRAAEVMLAVAGRWDPADLGYSLVKQAAYHARTTKNYDDILQQYMKQIPRAHHLLPKLLNDLGVYYLGQKDRRVFTIQSQLDSVYGASAAREDLAERIERARAAAATPKGG